LWDDETNKIAGAYRMGLGCEIYPKYGMDGFYLNGLFRFEPELHDMLHKSIEMGRAFIIKEYQQKPMPLFCYGVELFIQPCIILSTNTYLAA